MVQSPFSPEPIAHQYVLVPPNKQLKFSCPSSHVSVQCLSDQCHSALDQFSCKQHTGCCDQLQLPCFKNWHSHSPRFRGNLFPYFFLPSSAWQASSVRVCSSCSTESASHGASSSSRALVQNLSLRFSNSSKDGHPRYHQGSVATMVGDSWSPSDMATQPMSVSRILIRTRTGTPEAIHR